MADISFLKDFLSTKNWSVDYFERLAGFNNGEISKAISNNYQTTDEVMDKIYTNFRREITLAGFAIIGKGIFGNSGYVIMKDNPGNTKAIIEERRKDIEDAANKLKEDE